MGRGVSAKGDPKGVFTTNEEGNLNAEAKIGLHAIDIDCGERERDQATLQFRVEAIACCGLQQA